MGTTPPSTSSRVRSRTPPPPPAPPIEELRLPHLEPLDSTSESAISSHLQKKRFLHSFSSNHSLQSTSPSSPKKPSKPSKRSTAPFASTAELSHSDEDVEWDEAPTHAPPSRHHHHGGVSLTIIHKGKKLVRNPEASQRRANERELRRLNERREKQRGAAGDVTMGRSEVDSFRRKGSYNSQQGVRGKLNRAGSRIVRTVGLGLGEGSDTSENEGGGGGLSRSGSRVSSDGGGGGGSMSLRKTSTRASSIAPLSPRTSHSTLRSISHIVTHPFSSSHRSPSSPSQPPSATASNFPPPPSSSQSLHLLSPTTTHAAGEDPNLPPSSAPLGMVTSNPPQLPRLDSGMQLLTTASLSTTPTPSTNRPSSSISREEDKVTPLPSPPRTPTAPTLDIDAPPSFNPQAQIDDLPSRPTSFEFLSPTPLDDDSTDTPPREPLPWGRDAPEALASAPQVSAVSTVEDVGVETWEDRREEIAQEEEEEARKGRAELEGGRMKLGSGAGKGGKGEGEVIWERLWENQRG